ncbi:diguanylate cyclase domain-containing protein [Bacillus suaedae]|uniref:Diguanylate cyclase n=1 Tax=Halalkalibacter suaedae TaxID=2822140 RepID=A0A941ATE5_9BACI|nr:diguanylate cyclase [Bacillus suaedae]MBP3951539.1 diguanylate cyclase [Bacillus suaedae]
MESGREPLKIEDTAQHPIASNLPPTEEFGIKCFLGAPIILGDGTLFGNICAVGTEEYTFSEDNIEIIKSMADFFAYVIELENSVFQDSLTGLNNRRFVDQFLSTITFQRGAVLFLDLDNFKSINDSYGHDIGDGVLIEVSQRLKKIVRKNDHLVRLAGDEFLVILPDLDQEESSQVAERMLDALSETVTLKGYSFSVTASIGSSFFPEDGKTLEVLMKKADISMYAAKRQGDNVYKTYSEDRDIESTSYSKATEDSSMGRSASLINGQKKILEMVLNEFPLQDILHYLVSWIEKQTDSHICSISLFDEMLQSLILTAAPNLPIEFRDEIKVLPIGTNIGSCGAAAAEKRLVITENISLDPKWTDYKESALQSGLHSCWSMPILSSKNKLIGTFAIYGLSPKTPNEADIYFLQSVSYLICLAIERKEAVESLDQLSNCDLLTGVGNRTFFYQQLNQSLKTLNDSTKLALLFVDIDRFKKMNSSMGLYFGDQVLKVTVERMNHVIDQTRHKLFRIDGDEFVIILDLNPGENPSEIAKDILNVFKEPFHYQNEEFTIPIRVGVSIHQEGEEIEQLINKGLKALVYAKKSDNLYIAGKVASDTSQDHNRFILENDLRKVIERNELSLVYQPQYDMNRNEMIGMEALIRWKHAEKGFISPVDFIPLAEENGSIIAIGNWVLLTVCNQINEWKAKGFLVPTVAVNISPVQLQNENFVQSLLDIFTLTGCEPTSISLEITESMTLDIEKTMSLFKQLNDININISVDDFGTGYSSLYYLDQLPIDQVKIDKSFIQNKSKQAIVKSIVEMANNLQIEVIAEGVETSEQVQFLQEINCTYAQGYYFSKPISDVEKLLRLK